MAASGNSLRVRDRIPAPPGGWRPTTKPRGRVAQVARGVWLWVVYRITSDGAIAMNSGVAKTQVSAIRLCTDSIRTQEAPR